MCAMRVLATLLLAASLAACSGGGGGSNADAAWNGPPANGGSSGPNSPTPDPGNGPLPVPPVAALTCSPCKQIVFVSTRDGNPEIYRIDLDSGALSRLTSNDAYDGEPAWSPDGTRIAFISDRDAGDSPWPPSDLYVMDADGGNVRRLTFSGSAWSRPVWSPDGTRIVYGGGSIYEVSPEGGTPRLLFSTPGVNMQPAWAPDGTRLAVVSDWAAYDFVYDIYLINADSSGFTAVTGNIFDHIDYLDPAWCPDGGTIATTVTRTLGIDTYERRLGLLNTSGSQLTMLPTPAGVEASTPAWSPDGTVIAYTSCSGARCQLSWIRADGSARGEIATDGYDPDWQR
jgi:Tol biopolymer transport system component